MAGHGLRLVVAGTAVALSLSFAGAVRAQDPAVEEALLSQKCSLCHHSKRIYQMDPAKVKETVERMRTKNPNWISTVENDHIAAVISKLVNDPNVMASRLAWQEAQTRGEARFNDTTLGSKGVSCASCHKPEVFKQIEDTYPRWDVKLKRFVGLDETIVIMMREKVGADVVATDQRVIDLLIYLKSL